MSHRFTDSQACLFLLVSIAAYRTPVDMLILEDGSILVSEDRVGATYRTTDDRYPAGPADQK